jgi:hypothetical protein
MKKIFFSIIATIILVIYLGNSCANNKLPQPFNPFGNYGFKVGQTYSRTHVTENPFSENWKPDTIKVVSIIKDYIKFSNNSTMRFGSIGANFYSWELIKE